MCNKVFMIIVTWKGMQWIDKCLTSIRNSQHPVRTIIIDNNSSDETPDYVAKHFSEMTLIRSQKNLGFGKANNIGIQQALKEGADYCFLLNQDAYLQTNTIDKLLYIAKTGDYAIISPIHLNGDGSRVDFYFRDFVLGKSSTYLDKTIIGGKNSIFECKFIPAAAWFLPRKTIEEIGGFDPLFYHYGEDDNYCQRCLYHQRKIVFTTTAFIQHDRKTTVGNQAMYNKKLAYRHLLQDSANILYGKGYIIQKLGRKLYDEIGLFFMYLLTGQWNMIHNFIGDYCKLLTKIPAIHKSRSLNKTVHSINV